MKNKEVENNIINQAVVSGKGVLMGLFIPCDVCPHTLPAGQLIIPAIFIMAISIGGTFQQTHIL